MLAACYTSQKYRWFTTRHNVDYLIERTSNFVGNLAPLAPTMRTNLRILQNLTEQLRRTHHRDESGSQDSHGMQASASFTGSSSGHG